MSEPFLGEIRIFGGNFAPRGWAFCNGQLMSISQNTALFSLLGTTYGGDGRTTFGLPDLRGRVPVSAGQGPGLSNYSLGEQAGTESVTLQQSQMPAHNHLLACNNGTATQPTPGGNFVAAPVDSQSGASLGFLGTSDGSTMNAGSVIPAGGSVPVEILQPFLCLSFIIALEGIFPSRN